ncbi:MAG: DUF364 domain-containing protein [Gammaproteobacteria bacterium]
MSGLRDTLVEQAARVCAAFGPLHLGRALFGDPTAAAVRDAEFGLLALEDGAAGLYYAWLGGEQALLPQRFRAADFTGVDVMDVVRLYRGEADTERSLGLAAISAVTAYLHARAGYRAPDAPDSMAGLDLAPGTRLGFIGHFAPLVRAARARGIDVAVVERKAHLVHAEPGLVVSLDPAVLHDRTIIICTGATLLNDSFETMLVHCRQADRLLLVGPTVGFFPDVVFARGVDTVAGTSIVDTSLAVSRLAAGHKVGDAGRRTLIARDAYPGFDALLERARRAPA